MTSNFCLAIRNSEEPHFTTYVESKGYIREGGYTVLARKIMPISESEEYPHSIVEEKLDSKRDYNRKTSLRDSMEYEVVIQMQPKKKYSIEIDVINISKAKPKIILPDTI